MLRLFKKLTTREILDIHNIHKYITEIAAPQLSLPSDILSHLSEIKVGSNTKLFLLQKSESEKYIIKFFPVRSDIRKGTEQYILNSLLLKHSINVPKIIFFDSNKTTIKKYNFEVIVEEYIDGRHITTEDLNTPKTVEQIAAILKKMHSIKTRYFGKPWIQTNVIKNTSLYFKMQIKKFLKKIDTHYRHLSKTEINNYFSFFMNHLQSTNIFSFSFYELTHNDFSPENILINSERKIYLIDFGAMAYFFFESDLVNVWLHISREDEKLFNTIIDRYFENEEEEKRRRFETNRQFFLAYYYLQKAAANSKKSRRIHRKSGEVLEDFRSQAEFYWGKFLETVKMSDGADRVGQIGWDG